MFTRNSTPLRTQTAYWSGTKCAARAGRSARAVATAGVGAASAGRVGGARVQLLPLEVQEQPHALAHAEADALRVGARVEVRVALVRLGGALVEQPAREEVERRCAASRQDAQVPDGSRRNGRKQRVHG